MPAASRSDSLKEKIRALPDGPGVYLMKDRLGRIIYVGKAKSLKKRVSSYFQPGRARALRHQPKIRTLIEMITDFDIIGVKSEPEALLLEGKLIKQWRPKYNTDFTDDKRFLLVRLDLAAPLPRFVLTRFRKDTRSRYFGPFAHSGLLRKTLASMRRKFGILLADTTPVRISADTWQLYDDARADISGWPNVVTAEEYRRRVVAAAEFLDGKSREWLATLRAEMSARAARQEFEKAAGLRDVVLALEHTLARTRKFTRDLTQGRPDAVALRQLQAALGLEHPPQHMECFDISHISGTFVVASLVRFTAGRPDRDQYRRFAIKSFIGNDDFKAMEEVVARRYRRLIAEQKPFPDLVVIDGGRGQVAAALKAFVGLDCPPPALIGLAKKQGRLILLAPRPDRPREETGDHHLPRRPRPAQPAARPPRAQPAPAPARRGAPLRPHLQRRPPVAENQGECPRRLPRPRPQAEGRPPRPFRFPRQIARGHRRPDRRGPRLRQQVCQAAP